MLELPGRDGQSVHQRHDHMLVEHAGHVVEPGDAIRRERGVPREELVAPVPAQRDCDELTCKAREEGSYREDQRIAQRLVEDTSNQPRRISSITCGVKTCLVMLGAELLGDPPPERRLVEAMLPESNCECLDRRSGSGVDHHRDDRTQDRFPHSEEMHRAGRRFMSRLCTAQASGREPITELVYVLGIRLRLAAPLERHVPPPFEGGATVRASEADVSREASERRGASTTDGERTRARDIGRAPRAPTRSGSGDAGGAMRAPTRTRESSPKPHSRAASSRIGPARAAARVARHPRARRRTCRSGARRIWPRDPRTDGRSPPVSAFVANSWPRASIFVRSSR